MAIELKELDRCPVCKGERIKELFGVYPVSYEFEVTEVSFVPFSICQCGMVFSNTVPADMEEYYRRIYRTTTIVQTSDITELNLRTERKRMLRLLPEIVKRLHKVERAMDIGSSSGKLLSAIGEHYGCKLQGVELNEEYRKYSNEHGVPSVSKLSEVEGTFDLITCIHTLEHVINPVEFLTEIVGKGKDATYLIEVPFASAGFNHPIFYTYATLAMVLEMAGLRIVDKVIDTSLTVFAKELECLEMKK